MKEGGAIILSVVLLRPPVSCPGDAVFHCERVPSLFDPLTLPLSILILFYKKNFSLLDLHSSFTACSLKINK